MLTRAKNTVHVGASSDQRKLQAAEAYRLTGCINLDKQYLLLDDVWTTGSSMMAAAELFRRAGANNVSALLLARTI